MIIGQAPNQESLAAGIPFLGPTGHKLREWLNYLSLEEKQVYLTEAVKCQAERTYPNQADQLSYAQKHACRPWLKDEIKRVRPKVAVLLGSDVKRMILEGNSVTFGPFRESYCWSHLLEGVTYFALPHPSYVLRHPEANATTLQDLDELRQLLRIEGLVV